MRDEATRMDRADAIDLGAVAGVRRRVQGDRVLVILDSLHTPEHVYDELQTYSPLVDVGSYVSVQDAGLGNILAYQLAAGGVRQFLQEGSGFEVDERRERFMITNNVRRYLGRVR